MTQKRKIGLLRQGELGTEFVNDDIQIFDEASEDIARQTPNLFILTNALSLPEIAEVAQMANKIGHLKGLLIQQHRDLNWIISLMDRAGLRQLRHTFVHSDLSAFERVLNAWRMGAEQHLIADATIQQGILFVRNCALQTMDVAVDKIAALDELSEDELLRFRIAEDGTYIHWPEGEVHLELESIRVAKDPKLRAEFRMKRLESDAAMGRAVRSLREQAGLRQKDIEGLSPRQVRRIEKAEEGTSPTTSNLRHFAEAHELSLNDYLNRVAEEMGRADNDVKNSQAAE